VIVTVAGDRDAIAVAVRDHGVGLKPGQEQLVFDRFWRADPARARTTGGTGLGLAIALEDAQLHGGWLQAWGMPGKGSVFRLTIPRVAGQKLVGSPLPLVPDDTDAITALGEIMPGGLLLPGQLSPSPAQPSAEAATDDATAAINKTTGANGSSGTGVGSRG
jgi:Histidine kinase-, DNA gyrase B-, and HSP90-like ATPase